MDFIGFSSLDPRVIAPQAPIPGKADVTLTEALSRGPAHGMRRQTKGALR
ncbi:hypothetical protein [Rhodobacter lacus]|uniref:Uncharacterized protein n=1 Tax=Rhodobacter lacus TaxID=1641972 RepID=A0ABW5ABT8_9RHOB